VAFVLVAVINGSNCFRSGLPYLNKKNFWQPQWLLFATTNKR